MVQDTKAIFHSWFYIILNLQNKINPCELICLPSGVPSSVNIYLRTASGKMLHSTLHFLIYTCVTSLLKYNSMPTVSQHTQGCHQNTLYVSIQHSNNFTILALHVYTSTFIHCFGEIKPKAMQVYVNDKLQLVHFSWFQFLIWHLIPVAFSFLALSYHSTMLF